MLDLNRKISSRTIRVFLSSTFRDMDVERRYLINTIFPALRSLARERKVELTEVDLRWGITDTEAQSDNTVRLCLTEIDECRKKSEELPFFIGLMGGRYGWVPGTEDVAKDNRLREEFEMVDKYIAQGLSVTEMEIRHAVLDRVKTDPGVRRQSFFFFRDQAFTDILRARFPKVVYTEDDDGSLSAGEKIRAAESLARLRANIYEVMANNEPLSYKDEKELGDLVGKAFTGFLNTHFPLEAIDKNRMVDPISMQTDHLEVEQRAQALFAGSRIAEYVEREGWNETVALFTGDTRPVLLCGSAGSGKTTLMAVLIAQLQKRENAPEALYHFSGATAGSALLSVMLRRLISELRRAAGLPVKVPADDRELPSAMIDAMYAIPVSKNILLAIDALDQLDDHENLSWLPIKLPTNIQVVVSVKSPVDGKPHPLVELFERRSPRVFRIGPLTVAEREAIIGAFLKRYGKRIDTGLLALIVAFRESEIPLVLRAILEEMRLIGDHHALIEQVRRYLATDNVESFFACMFERIERDFSLAGDNKRGATELLALLNAAHEGLSETEIMDLMNPDGAESGAFTALQWSGLHEVLRPHIMEQNGCMTWSHEMIRRASAVRYEYAKDSCHRRLADYFLDGKRMLTGHALREWPWHLRQLNERNKMEGLFRQGKVCVALLKENENDAHHHWLWLAQGQENQGDWIARSANQWLGEPWENVWDLETLRCYLTDRVGRPDQAVALGERIVEEQTRLRGPEALDTVAAQHNLANTYTALDRHSDASRLREKVAERYSRIFGPNALATIAARESLATSYYFLNRLETALNLFKEAVQQRTHYQGPDATDTIAAKNFLANAWASLNRHDEAMKLGEEVLEQRVRLLGPDALDTIAAKNNLAATYSSLNRHQEALTLKVEVLRQRTQQLGPDALETVSAKHNLANTCYFLCRYEEAQKLSEEVVDQFTTLLGPGAERTITAKQNLANIYFCVHRYKEALMLAEEVVELWTSRAGAGTGCTITAKYNLANMNHRLNRDEIALRLFKEVVDQWTHLYGSDSAAVRMAEQGLKDTLASLDCRDHSMGPEKINEMRNNAIRSTSQNRNDAALNHWQGLLEQRKRLLGRDAPDTLAATMELANVFSSLNRHEEAMKLEQEALQGYLRTLGPDEYTTVKAKQNLSATFSSLRLHEDALILKKEVLRQFLVLLGSDAPDTIAAKQNLANSYASLNRHQEALSLRVEVMEQRIRLAPETLDTVDAKKNVAIGYTKVNRHLEAMHLFQDVLVRQTSLLGPDAPGTIVTKARLANVFYVLKRFQEAMRLREEVLEQWTRLRDADTSTVIQSKRNLAISYTSLKRYPEALKLYQEVLERQTELFGSDAPGTIEAKNNAAFCYAFMKRYTEALKLFNEVAEHRTRLLGPDAKDTLAAKKNYDLFFTIANATNPIK